MLCGFGIAVLQHDRQVQPNLRSICHVIQVLLLGQTQGPFVVLHRLRALAWVGKTWFSQSCSNNRLLAQGWLNKCCPTGPNPPPLPPIFGSGWLHNPCLPQTSAAPGRRGRASRRDSERWLAPRARWPPAGRWVLHPSQCFQLPATFVGRNHPW